MGGEPEPVGRRDAAETALGLSPHADLARLRDEHLEPEFRTALAACGPGGGDPDSGDPGVWRPLVRELAPRVHALRVLTRDWCARLLEEVERIEERCAAAGVEPTRPNSMNDHGLVLEPFGFGRALDELVRRCIRPLAAHLHPGLGGASLDGHHAFVVDYALDRDLGLGWHVDDSEVTLNLCLGGDFDGSELYLRGMRCELHRQTPWRPDEAAVHEHEPGVAVLHAGPQRHGVHPLLGGRRRNLIVWCRSSSYRAVRPTSIACPEWCGARRATTGGA